MAVVMALGLFFAVGLALSIQSLGLALTIVTMLHMIIGEQAPKIWAIQRAESLALGRGEPVEDSARVISSMRKATKYGPGRLPISRSLMVRASSSCIAWRAAAKQRKSGHSSNNSVQST